MYPKPFKALTAPIAAAFSYNSIAFVTFLPSPPSPFKYMFAAPHIPVASPAAAAALK